MWELLQDISKVQSFLWTFRNMIMLSIYGLLVACFQAWFSGRNLFFMDMIIMINWSKLRRYVNRFSFYEFFWFLIELFGAVAVILWKKLSVFWDFSLYCISSKKIIFYDHCENYLVFYPSFLPSFLAPFLLFILIQHHPFYFFFVGIRHGRFVWIFG